MLLMQLIKQIAQRHGREVCFACVDAEEFRLAQICGLNIIIQVDDLKEVSDYYQNRGCFNESIFLMESGLVMERTHMGIYGRCSLMPCSPMQHLTKQNV